MVKNALWVMEVAGVGWGLVLELAYPGSNHQARVAILAQGFQDSESREVVLLHCGLYDMCECGMYIQPDFKIVLNNLAHARGMQISRDGWAALEVGAT
jgi:hypothetical protein